MKHGFETMGYNRVVWRCFTQNAASLRAAKRFGFTPEGVWRDGGMLNGQLCDVSWHSMLSADWPTQKSRIEAWLDPENFDEDGQSLRPMART